MVAVAEPPTTAKPLRPASSQEKGEQPKYYTIVFTAAYPPEKLQTLGYTREQLSRMHPSPRNVFYNAVVGEKAAKRTDTGEIVAVEDKLSFVRATPHFPSLGGYLLMDEWKDRAVATSDDLRNLRSGYEIILGRENYDLMQSMFRMDGKVVFERINDLYIALFPVTPVPKPADYIEDPNARSYYAEQGETVKEILGTLGKILDIPPRSSIIPTLSKKPFPNASVTPNELRRLRTLRRVHSALEFYRVLEELFERANGDPDQFLLFDEGLIPDEYKDWPVMNIRFWPSTKLP